MPKRKKQIIVRTSDKEFKKYAEDYLNKPEVLMTINSEYSKMWLEYLIFGEIKSEEGNK